MSRLLLCRDLASHLPPAAGIALSRIPYVWRLGTEYSRTQRRRREFANLNHSAQQQWMLDRVREIVGFAASKIPFFRDHYRGCGFDPASLQRFEDLPRIPLVSRADLKAVPLRNRSCPAPQSMLVNTGGTSGEPLDFYVDRSAYAREWAHMHFIWSHLGYRPGDLKLTFRGRNLGSRPFMYSAVHNEFLINTYVPLESQASTVAALAGRYKVRFIHGYPSALYAFCRHCLEQDPAALSEVTRTLRGVFLASEYPAPVFRKTIEEALKAPTLAWYGHSEMAVLAWERERDVYEPLHSYGFCEAVAGDSNTFHLVGTSYFNRVSPFIRYDTGDLIQPSFKDGLLTSFAVVEGRVGDFILDSAGAPISLTALIFGRHHELFADVRFVQVSQVRPGEATLLITLAKGCKLNPASILEHFDASHVRVDFRVEVLDGPITSALGKVPLRVTTCDHPISRGK